jgi:hypothetical protein
MKVRFHPQAWINDCAVEADPQGPTDFEVGGVPDHINDDSYESDQYRSQKTRPLG